MNIYTSGDHQRHCVVADDMKTAVKIWEDYYGYEPKNLEIYSSHVLIQGTIYNNNKKEGK